jgi:hypothetical protein
VDRSRVKEIVDREIEPLMARLGLDRWSVEVKYGPIGDDQSGRCSRLYDYERATIEFDPEKIEDEADVLKTLRHELFHVVHSPFDLYSCAVDNAGLGKTMDDVLDRVWRHACEKTVINLERLYQGLTSPADATPPAPVVD